MGWFPESYVERVTPSVAANSAAAATAAASAASPKLPLQSQLSNALEAAKMAGTKSAFTPTHSPNPANSEAQGHVRALQSTVHCWTLKLLHSETLKLFVSVLAGGGEPVGPGLVFLDSKNRQPSEL